MTAEGGEFWIDGTNGIICYAHCKACPLQAIMQIRCLGNQLIVDFLGQSRSVFIPGPGFHRHCLIFGTTQSQTSGLARCHVTVTVR